MVEKGFWSDPYFMTLRTWKRRLIQFPGNLSLSNQDNGFLPQFTPVKIQGDEKSYPLVLIPYDSIRLANGFIGDPPFVIKTVEDTVLKGKDVFVET